MKNQRIFIILVITVSLLLIPFIAMQFTYEVQWNATDFIIAGILLFGTGILFELVMRKVKRISYKFGLIAILVLLLLLTWMELAVGLFDTPLAGS